jgi:hypothetical protein
MNNTENDFHKVSFNGSPLDHVTTVKGYSEKTGIGIRTVQRMCESGKLKAKNENGIWLIEYRSLEEGCEE